MVLIIEYIVLGAENNHVEPEENSKQVEVFLHTEVEKAKAKNGDIKTCIDDASSNNCIDDANTKVLKDKKHKTTNVPSNCSTAILMPLNGVKKNSQQRDSIQKSSIDMKEFDTINADNEASTTRSEASK